MTRRVVLLILLVLSTSACGGLRRSWNEFSGHPDTTAVASKSSTATAKAKAKASKAKTANTAKTAKHTTAAAPQPAPAMAPPPVVAARPATPAAQPAAPAAPPVTAPCISCQMTSRSSATSPVLTANAAPVYPLPNDAAVQADGWVTTNVATPVQVADWYALSFAKGGFHLTKRVVSPDGATVSFCVSPQALFVSRPVFDQIYATPRTKFKVVAVVAPAVQPGCA